MAENFKISHCLHPCICRSRALEEHFIINHTSSHQSPSQMSQQDTFQTLKLDVIKKFTTCVLSEQACISVERELERQLERHNRRDTGSAEPGCECEGTPSAQSNNNPDVCRRRNAKEIAYLRRTLSRLPSDIRAF